MGLGRHDAHEAPAPVVLRPPLWMQISRWFAFTATVAIAVGILAMLDRHLTDLPWIYDGPRPEFQGRTVSVDYCMLSSSALVPSDIRCRLAFTAAAVSLALSLVWTYIQSLRRNPYKHRNARIADFILCLIATAWWIACGIFLSLWTHQANNAGLRNANWRVGLCILAWAEFLFFAFLTITSALLLFSKSQKLFDRWEAKRKLRKEQRYAAKQERMQHEALEAEAAAAAARHKPIRDHSSHHDRHHHAVEIDHAPAGAAVAPAMLAPAAVVRQQQHVHPVATTSNQSAWPSATTTAAAAARGDDNPFRADHQEAALPVSVRQPLGEHAV